MLSLLQRNLSKKIGFRSISSGCGGVKPPQSPWLMLPPLFRDGDMLYNFYSLADDRVFTFNKRRGRGAVDSDEIPPDDAKLVGSSHGWLASFDERTNHVFLSNPISGKHVKLPAIDTLPDPHINLFEGRGSVSRVILSASPDEPTCKGGEACHAVTTFGPGGRLAFCRVGGASSEWAPLGDKLSWYEEKQQHVKFAMRPWEDFVHSTARGEFITVQPLSFDICDHFVYDKYGKHEKHGEIFHWKIPGGFNGATSVTGYERNYNTRHDHETPQHYDMLETECILTPHLVCAENLSRLPLIVLRYLHRGIGSDADQKLASPEVHRARVNAFPYRSVSFVVLKHSETYSWKFMKDLKGMALFVGMNHAFAIPAYGKLKPNSIYFTDAGRITPPDPDHAPQTYGGHDIGIFDYEKKTTSPCYYPCDFESFKRIDPPPMWFTPSFS